MQSLGQLGGAIGTGASAVGNAALQGAEAVGGGIQKLGQGLGQQFLGAGQNPTGSFMGPMQPMSGLQKVAPYLTDFLNGQGMAGQLLGKALPGVEGGFDTGMLGQLLGSAHQGGGSQVPGIMAGYLGGHGGGGARQVEGAPMPEMKAQHGLIGGIIQGATPSTEVKLGENRPSKIGKVVDLALKYFGIPLSISQQPASSQTPFGLPTGGGMMR